MSKAKSQCLSRIQKEVHSERPVAMGANLVLGPVVFDRHIAIIKVARQRAPTSQAVIDRTDRVTAIEIDNNIAERALRTVALGRKKLAALRLRYRRRMCGDHV